METIFALASARGRAGVSVIRVSGPQAKNAALVLCGSLPKARQAGVRRITWRGDVIDDALVLSFDAGASFTGEDVVEFQVHGSVAVVKAVLAALAEQPGLRVAEAGEFTRRALENGRLDLSEVEGLGDLIEAETELQRQRAMAQMSGGLRRLADDLRAKLVRAAALIEATIDFADEDVPVDVTPEVLDLIGAVLPELQAQVDGFGVAERLRDGFEVVIVGRPNAGKSTLLNALAGREAAITSTIAGTTRDLIEVRMDLAGLPVTVVDTAGLREAGDEIERIGIAKAIERARMADLCVALLDGADPLPLLAEVEIDIAVQAKADEVAGPIPAGRIAISGKTGQGIAALIEEIGRRLERKIMGASAINRMRHLEAVSRAIMALESARIEVLGSPDRMELVAERLREAIRALESLVGRVDVEHLLGEIFANFCIGK
ncbi:MAG: tRNA uridine-5-carboxymethylaminomethyl(34) synthesis GTPase MnmE [Paenirhodobacter sp.]|uniref:tRNA uridine-5-carboxymethylaminomethyl(34) synthesis GTPase MnmE n=1 Tax=Paenirhodobacter sp. TaxID=1965326 RepID=UPI003D0D6A99